MKKDKSLKAIINPLNQFVSTFGIDDEVQVDYSVKERLQSDTVGKEPWIGQIVRVSFTKAKVFYDVLAFQDSQVYKNIDSINVKSK